MTNTFNDGLSFHLNPIDFFRRIGRQYGVCRKRPKHMGSTTATFKEVTLLDGGCVRFGHLG